MRAQKGSTLVTVLILLLIMTILGVYSVRGTFYTEKLVRNISDYSLACERANYALNSFELTVDSENNKGALRAHKVETASSVNAFETIVYDDTHWKVATENVISLLESQGNALTTAYEATPGSFGAFQLIAGDKRPRVLVEEFNEVLTSNMNMGNSFIPEGVGVYRLTAIGYGSSESKCVVQSNYMVRLNI